MEDRVILHVDANNFFASVEISLNNELRGKAVAVSGNPEKRHGIILAKSQLAKKAGVTTGEAIWQAKRKCPDLILVAPHYDEYVRFSNMLFDIYKDYTDRVEPFSIDECWLDVTHSLKLFHSGENIATMIRERVQRELGITVSVGVSFTKIFAKLGSDMKKPNATTIITRDNYKSVVWPLPVRDLMMVGSSTEKVFKKLNILTIGDLAVFNVELLKKNLGIIGERLSNYARGIENEDVRYYYEKRIPESVGHATTMPNDVTDLKEIEAVFSALSEMVATRLRRLELEANVITIFIKYNDLSSVTRRASINIPTNTASDIVHYAMNIFREHIKKSDALPIRSLGVSTARLTPVSERSYQMSFFESKDVKNEMLERTVDELRKKYGYDIMMKANVMKYSIITSDLKDDEFLPFKK